MRLGRSDDADGPGVEQCRVVVAGSCDSRDARRISSVSVQPPTVKQMSRAQEYLAKAEPGYRSFPINDGYVSKGFVPQPKHSKLTEEHRKVLRLCG